MPTQISHTGIVTDNDDPEKRGRLCVECPTIVADDFLEWVEPEFFFVDSDKQAGAFFVPNISAQVEVKIDDGPESEITGLNPKWKCTIYPDGTVPDEFQENYPQRRGWKTAAGHIFYFDDTEESLSFHYKHPSGAKITVDNDGNIRLDTDASVYIGTGADSKAHPITRGNILESLLNDIVTFLTTHKHTGISTGTAISATYDPVTNPIPPSVPSDLNSDDHYVD